MVSDPEFASVQKFTDPFSISKQITRAYLYYNNNNVYRLLYVLCVCVYKKWKTIAWRTSAFSDNRKSLSSFSFCLYVRSCWVSFRNDKHIIVYKYIFISRKNNASRDIYEYICIYIYVIYVRFVVVYFRTETFNWLFLKVVPDGRHYIRDKVQKKNFSLRRGSLCYYSTFWYRRAHTHSVPSRPITTLR